MSRKMLLLRWSVLFTIGNILLFWLLGSPSLFANGWLQTIPFNLENKLIINLFNILIYFGQVGLFAILLSCFVILLILIIPKRRFIFPVSIALGTFLAFIFFIDVFTFKIYRFHLNSAILDLAVNGLSEQVWEISTLEVFLLGAVAVGLAVIETALCILAWRYMQAKIFTRFFKVFLISTPLGCLFISYSILILSSGTLLNRILNTMGDTLPFYKDVFEVVLPNKFTQIAINRLPGNFLKEGPCTALNYPLKKIECHAAQKPKNLLIIVIDTWRYDMLNANNTPFLTVLANKSWLFTNHFSGGNATGPGIFSLFYSLPASYWSLMKQYHRGPVIIDELIKQNYQMAIFSSATLHLPAFDKTVFSALANLRMGSPGATPYDRDRAVTQGFQEFIATKRDPAKPFFGFLFYDAVHSYCGFQEDLQPLVPAVQYCNHLDLTNDTDPTPYFNRYKNALTLVDQEIKTVYETLAAKHLLDDTIIVVTGDHGEEFNDNHLGFWGHGSNFTHYQVQTPLIVAWPGSKPKTINYQTSHFDIVPTLMNNLLGCKTSLNAYSLGRNLFDTRARPYLILGSYTGYAVIEPKHILYISLNGNIDIQHLSGRPFPEEKLGKKTLKFVFDDVERFWLVPKKEA